MADVILHAALPSVRLGLVAMLAERGHHVLANAQAGDEVVWVIDRVDAQAIEHFLSSSRDELPPAAVLLVDDEAIISQVARAGLRGWAVIGRDVGAEELDLAVRAAAAGLVLVDPRHADSVRPRFSVSASAGESKAREAEPLTRRELQVLQLVAQGQPNKGIARALGIAENTAKFHVASVIAKLGSSGRTEAVTLAARRGLIVL